MCVRCGTWYKYKVTFRAAYLLVLSHYLRSGRPRDIPSPEVSNLSSLLIESTYRPPRLVPRTPGRTINKRVLHSSRQLPPPSRIRVLARDLRVLLPVVAHVLHSCDEKVHGLVVEDAVVDYV